MGVVYTGSCVYMAKLGMILTECTQRKQTHRIEEIIMENKTDFEPESTYGRHTSLIVTTRINNGMDADI